MFTFAKIDTDFQELFAQIYDETTRDEYINFDAETLTLEPAFDPTHLDWWQECREKSIAEVLQSENTASVNNSDDKIADDKQDVRKMTASETLDSLYTVSVLLKLMEISKST